MVTATTSKQEPFSIPNFQKLFNVSPAKKYLTRFEVDQIRMAMEKKDFEVLEKLYVILREERGADEDLTRNFVIAKNRIMDDFMLKAKGIENKYVELPKRKAASKEEAKEKAGAEDILSRL